MVTGIEGGCEALVGCKRDLEVLELYCEALVPIINSRNWIYPPTPNGGKGKEKGKSPLGKAHFCPVWDNISLVGTRNAIDALRQLVRLHLDFDPFQYK